MSFRFYIDFRKVARNAFSSWKRWGWRRQLQPFYNGFRSTSIQSSCCHLSTGPPRGWGRG